MAITSRLIYLCSIIHWISLLGFKGAIKIQVGNGIQTDIHTDIIIVTILGACISS